MSGKFYYSENNSANIVIVPKTNNNKIQPACVYEKMNSAKTFSISQANQMNTINVHNLSGQNMNQEINQVYNHYQTNFQQPFYNVTQNNIETTIPTPVGHTQSEICYWDSNYNNVMPNVPTYTTALPLENTAINNNQQWQYQPQQSEMYTHYHSSINNYTPHVQNEYYPVYNNGFIMAPCYSECCQPKTCTQNNYQSSEVCQNEHLAATLPNNTRNVQKSNLLIETEHFLEQINSRKNPAQKLYNTTALPSNEMNIAQDLSLTNIGNSKKYQTPTEVKTEINLDKKVQAQTALTETEIKKVQALMEVNKFENDQVLTDIHNDKKSPDQTKINIVNNVESILSPKTINKTQSVINIVNNVESTLSPKTINKTQTKINIVNNVENTLSPKTIYKTNTQSCITSENKTPEKSTKSSPNALKKATKEKTDQKKRKKKSESKENIKKPKLNSSESKNGNKTHDLNKKTLQESPVRKINKLIKINKEETVNKTNRREQLLKEIKILEETLKKARAASQNSRSINLKKQKRSINTKNNKYSELINKTKKGKLKSVVSISDTFSLKTSYKETSDYTSQKKKYYILKDDGSTKIYSSKYYEQTLSPNKISTTKKNIDTCNDEKNTQINSNYNSGLKNNNKRDKLITTACTSNDKNNTESVKIKNYFDDKSKHQNKNPIKKNFKTHKKENNYNTYNQQHKLNESLGTNDIIDADTRFLDDFNVDEIVESLNVLNEELAICNNLNLDGNHLPKNKHSNSKTVLHFGLNDILDSIYSKNPDFIENNSEVQIDSDSFLSKKDTTLINNSIALVEDFDTSLSSPCNLNLDSKHLSKNKHSNNRTILNFGLNDILDSIYSKNPDFIENNSKVQIDSDSFLSKKDTTLINNSIALVEDNTVINNTKSVEIDYPIDLSLNVNRIYNLSQNNIPKSAEEIEIELKRFFDSSDSENEDEKIKNNFNISLKNVLSNKDDCTIQTLSKQQNKLTSIITNKNNIESNKCLHDSNNTDTTNILSNPQSVIKNIGEISNIDKPNNFNYLRYQERPVDLSKVDKIKKSVENISEMASDREFSPKVASLNYQKNLICSNFTKEPLVNNAHLGPDNDITLHSIYASFNTDCRNKYLASEKNVDNKIIHHDNFKISNTKQNKTEDIEIGNVSNLQENYTHLLGLLDEYNSEVFEEGLEIPKDIIKKLNNPINDQTLSLLDEEQSFELIEEGIEIPKNIVLELNKQKQNNVSATDIYYITQNNVVGIDNKKPISIDLSNNKIKITDMTSPKGKIDKTIDKKQNYPLNETENKKQVSKIISDDDLVATKELDEQTLPVETFFNSHSGHVIADEITVVDKMYTSQVISADNTINKANKSLDIPNKDIISADNIIVDTAMEIKASPNTILEKDIEFKLSALNEKLIHHGHFSKIYSIRKKCGEIITAKVYRKSIDCSDLMQKNEQFMKMQAEIPKENYNCVWLMNGLTIDGSWCSIMEYFPKNLNQALEENRKPFTIELIQRLARQLVTAVFILRDNSIVHTDITPRHILLSATNEKLKLCGFDEIHPIDQTDLTPIIGSVRYRAPEVILGHSAGPSIDVWSAALVLYKMATKIDMFTASTNNRLLFQQMRKFGMAPSKMLASSKFKSAHFAHNRFMKKSFRKSSQGYQKLTQLCDSFTPNTRWQTLMNKYYFKLYSKTEENTELLNNFINLLAKMLVIDVDTRLSIEFVCIDKFIH